MPPTPIQTSLEQFARTTRLGPFSLGMPRAEVESLLGVASLYADVDDLYVLRCDGVLFHCKGDGPVHYLRVSVRKLSPDARSIGVNPGLLQSGLSLRRVRRVLRTLNLNHGPVEVHRAAGHAFSKTIRLESGVRLSFTRDNWFRGWTLLSVGIRDGDAAGLLRDSDETPTLPG